MTCPAIAQKDVMHELWELLAFLGVRTVGIFVVSIQDPSLRTTRLLVSGPEKPREPRCAPEASEAEFRCVTAQMLH
jgi:hypothetical protein